MARNFNFNDSLNVGNATNGSPTLPLFVAGWVNLNSLTANVQVFCGRDKWWFAADNTAGKIRFTKSLVADIDSTLGLTAGVWTFITVTVRSNQAFFTTFDPILGLNTSTISDSGVIQTSTASLLLGNRQLQDLTLDGKAAWIMVAEGFDPSTAEIVTLALNPLAFPGFAFGRGAASAFLWPIDGISSPEPELITGINAGVLSGAATYADDPPFITRPMPEWFDRAIIAPATGFVPYDPWPLWMPVLSQ